MYLLVLFILLRSQPKVSINELQLKGLATIGLESLLETCEHF